MILLLVGFPLPFAFCSCSDPLICNLQTCVIHSCAHLSFVFLTSIPRMSPSPPSASPMRREFEFVKNMTESLKILAQENDLGKEKGQQVQVQAPREGGETLEELLQKLAEALRREKPKAVGS